MLISGTRLAKLYRPIHGSRELTETSVVQGLQAALKIDLRKAFGVVIFAEQGVSAFRYYLTCQTPWHVIDEAWPAMNEESPGWKRPVCVR